MTAFNYIPIIKRNLFDDQQEIFRFSNGYGASVVRHKYSYGGVDGKYELAVLKFMGSTNHWGITYKTPITDDVVGNLDVDGVNKILAQIAKLEVDTKTRHFGPLEVEE